MSALVEFSGRDVLADVLDAARVRGRIYCRGHFSAPWAIRFSAIDVSHFHVIGSGECWLRFDDGPASRLSANDLVVIPRGRAYELADALSTPPVRLDDILGDVPGSAHTVLRHGGGGAPTDLLCGAFEFRHEHAAPLLSVLPSVMHVSVNDESESEWLASAVSLLQAEARRADHGSETIVGRLTEIILVQAIRHWIRTLPDGAGGWLGALRDPALGAALRLIHDAPQKAWTVASLAAEVGMSRSPFARRFTTLVGMPPLAYLIRWRMCVAAELLRLPALSLEEIAARIGFESTAAFSRAFKKQFGVSPGLFRRNPAS